MPGLLPRIVLSTNGGLGARTVGAVAGDRVTLLGIPAMAVPMPLAMVLTGLAKALLAGPSPGRRC